MEYDKFYIPEISSLVDIQEDYLMWFLHQAGMVRGLDMVVMKLLSLVGASDLNVKIPNNNKLLQTWEHMWTSSLDLRTCWLDDNLK